MANRHYPNFYPVVWEGITFDRRAIGAVRTSSGDAAIWVAMRPSVFLGVATPLPVPRSSLEWIAARLEDGDAIAPAELRLDVTGKSPLALSHEGRHRMTALRMRLNDRPVPVRIAFAGMTDQDIEDREIVRWVRQGTRSQRGRSVVAGPLFEDAEPDLGGLPTSGVPPPGVARWCGMDQCESEAGGSLMGRWIDWVLAENLSREEANRVGEVMRANVIPATLKIAREIEAMRKRTFLSKLSTMLMEDWNVHYSKSADVFVQIENAFVVMKQHVPTDTLFPFEAGAYSCQSVGIQDYLVIGLIGAVQTETGKLSRVGGDDVDDDYISEVLGKLSDRSGYAFTGLTAITEAAPENTPEMSTKSSI